MWNILNKSGQHDTISIDSIKVFLCAIMNFNFHWMKPAGRYNDSDEGEHQKKKKVDADNVGDLSEDGHIVLLDEEISWITKTFHLFASAR